MAITIGRAADNDIVIGDDQTVSARHAEIIVDDRGRYYLTDRGSRNGTRIRRASQWQPVRQIYVEPDDRLMLGSYEVTVAELLRRMHTGRKPARHGSGNLPPATEMNDGGGDRGPGRFDSRPSGPVEFDPETGEIIKK